MRKRVLFFLAAALLFVAGYLAGNRGARLWPMPGLRPKAVFPSPMVVWSLR
jgi:hypothetical protein